MRQSLFDDWLASRRPSTRPVLEAPARRRVEPTPEDNTEPTFADHVAQLVRSLDEQT